MTTLHIYGIRHHGAGSARSLQTILHNIQPDIVLVEAPADATHLAPMLADKAMRPPVALLLYHTDDPKQAAYYPFAMFSPEYQAITYAIFEQVKIRFMDLPHAHRMPLIERLHDASSDDTGAPYVLSEPPDDDTEPTIPDDPLKMLAQAAGYDDVERWWDAMVEQRQNDRDIFQAVLEAMTAAREVLDTDDDSPSNPLEPLREAYMRQTIREAIDAGHETIAIVCGAWHAPVLQRDTIDTTTETDAALLHNLPSIDVAATWIPWTYSRLSKYTGYGAGVQSPGWYAYLWGHDDPETLSMGWLTQVAHHLRKNDLIASTAQVIDAVQLAEALAAMRGRSLPDLHDLNEATLSVLCHGNSAPMQLIYDDLIIGEAMGRVPDTVPKVTLQRDFEMLVDTLGLSLEKEEMRLQLDLRNERHRAISHLLHRMVLLGIEWGELQYSSIKKEIWFLEWSPGLFIRLIEKSAWGSTVKEAAENFALETAQSVQELPHLTRLVQQVLLAELPAIVEEVVQELRNRVADAGDIIAMMQALLPLVEIVVYGDIRQQHQTAVAQVVDVMSVRISIGLPTECVSLNDDDAQAILYAMIECDRALRLLDDSTRLSDWYAMLDDNMTSDKIHGLLRGRACRILTDAAMIPQHETVRRMRLAIGNVAQPEDAAAWLRGFLLDSGLVLVHDDVLLSVLDDWVATLSEDEFQALLPLMRRTFSTFAYGEVRHVAARVAGKPVRKTLPQVTIDAQLEATLDSTLAALLGANDHDSE